MSFGLPEPQIEEDDNGLSAGFGEFYQLLVRFQRNRKLEVITEAWQIFSNP